MNFLGHRFVRFLMVGGLNTLIGYAFYLLFLQITSYNYAYTITYLLSIITSYLFNLFFVFKEKHTIKKSLQFPLIYLVQFIFSLLTLNFLVSIVSIDQRVAPLIVIILSTPLTYGLMRIVLSNKTSKLVPKEAKE